MGKPSRSFGACRRSLPCYSQPCEHHRDENDILLRILVLLVALPGSGSSPASYRVAADAGLAGCAQRFASGLSLPHPPSRTPFSLFTRQNMLRAHAMIPSYHGTRSCTARRRCSQRHWPFPLLDRHVGIPTVFPQPIQFTSSCALVMTFL